MPLIVKLTTGDFAEAVEILETKMEAVETKLIEEHIAKSRVAEDKPKYNEKVVSSENQDIIFGREIKGETVSFGAFAELYKNEICTRKI